MQTNKIGWSDLPLEMQAHVLSYVSPIELKPTETVSRQWRETVNSPHVHPAWQRALDPTRVTPFEEYSRSELRGRGWGCELVSAMVRKPGYATERKNVEAHSLAEVLDLGLAHVVKEGTLPKRLGEKAAFLAKEPSSAAREEEYAWFKAVTARQWPLDRREDLAHVQPFIAEVYGKLEVEETFEWTENLRDAAREAHFFGAFRAIGKVSSYAMKVHNRRAAQVAPLNIEQQPTVTAVKEDAVAVDHRELQPTVTPVKEELAAVGYRELARASVENDGIVTEEEEALVKDYASRGCKGCTIS